MIFFLVLSDETTSSSEVSSLSSESSSDSDSDLLVEIQKKIGMIKASRKKQLEDSENSDPISKKKRDSLVQEHLISVSSKLLEYFPYFGQFLFQFIN